MLAALLFSLLLFLSSCNGASSQEPSFEVVSGPGGQGSVGWTENGQTAGFRLEMVIRQTGNFDQVFPVAQPFLADRMWGHVTYTHLDASCRGKDIAIAASLKAGVEELVPISIRTKSDVAQPLPVYAEWPQGMPIAGGIQLFFFDDLCHPTNLRIALTFNRKGP